MANRIINSKNNELLWTQEEIVKRFDAMSNDFAEEVAISRKDVIKAMKKGKLNLDQTAERIKGFTAACELMDAIIEQRFPEITRNMKKKK